MIELNGYHLNLFDFYQITQGKTKVKLGKDAIVKITNSRSSIQNLIESKNCLESIRFRKAFGKRFRPKICKLCRSIY